ncbi:Ig-like domain-containing protein [Xanthocytophaga agilis]|uniref:Ig-like domain-containing protein n=1 Tax=Xanthocytophaga agilis TaxID=3048010 RepID=A0AAE3R8H5_9BACT|nr:Ig-like domain-containing protein [Xanthocytophaga agilis]MDJ1505694.1 Ig-like domain-containing protein [Xanthocytophaga agilis]
MRKLMRMMLLAMVVSGAFIGITTAQTYNWNTVPIGGGGFVTSIKAHPKVPNLFFITKDVGTPYRWNATTQKWEEMMLFGKIPTTYWNWEGGAKCAEVAFDPSDATGNILYATIATGKGTVPGGGTSMGTLMKSTDRGQTWTDCQLSIKVTPNASDKAYTDRIAVDPNNSNVVYVTTTYNGTYKSTSAGAVGSWVKVNTSFPDSDIGRFVIFDKTGGVINGVTRNILIGGSQGVYRSTDGGNTFALMNGSPGEPRRSSFSNDGTLYVTQVGQSATRPLGGQGLYKWNGSSWSEIAPVAGKELGGIAVNPHNSNEVIVTTTGTWNNDVAYRSLLGGVPGSWTALVPTTRDASEAPHSLGNGANGNFGHNICAFMFDPFNAGHVWFTDMLDVGQTTNVWASTVHWKLRDAGLEEIVVSGNMVCPPSGSNFLLSTTGDVGGFDHKSFTSPPAKGMASFFSTFNGVNTSGVAFQQTNPDFIARVGSDGWNGVAIGGYSTNGGLSYTKFPTVPSSGSARGRVAVSANSQRIVWVTQGMITGGLTYYSTNLGATWTASTGLPSGILKPGDIYTIWAGMNPLAADKVNGDIFYVYSGGTVYVSTNGGVSFSAAATNLPNVGNVAQMNVETTPGKTGDLWIAFTTGLYHSTDTAKTFTKVNPNVVKNPKWVAVGKADTSASSNPIVFVTSESGTVDNRTYSVFRSDDNGQNWTTILTTVPDVVANLAADYHGRVFLGASGNGIFVGEPAGGPVVNVSVTPASDSVIVGFTRQFKSVLTPTYPTNSAVTWSSSDTSIATVNASGLVTGISPGTVTITVTTQDGGKTAQSTLKVTPTVAVSGISLDSVIIMGLGTSQNLIAKITPANATNKAVNWSLSDTTVAKINSSGLLSALKFGTTVVTATTVDGAKTATSTVTIGTSIIANNCGGPSILNFIADTPSSGSMWTTGTTTPVSTTGLTNPAPAQVYLSQRQSGQPMTYTYKGLIPNSKYKVRLHFAEISTSINAGQRRFNVTGNSVADTLLKNFDIYTQAGGRFKAIIREFEIHSNGAGQISVVFRPIANYSYPAVSAIEVLLTPLTSIAITPTSFFVGVGDTTRLSTTATPANASNQRVLWSSSNSAIVTVDSKGLVKGMSPGNAIITATSEEGGFTASSTVTAANIPVSGITLSSTTASVGVNNTVTLTATLQPANATNKAYTWSSSDTTVLTISQNGLLKGISPGNATITVTTQDGNKTATCAVSVSNILISSIVLSKSALTVGVADTTSLKASVLPATASNKNVNWSSSAPGVATVNANGKITAIGVGTANIIATAQDAGGVSSTAQLTVVSAGSCGLMTNNGFESGFVNWILPNGSKTKVSETITHSGLKSVAVMGDNSAINYGSNLIVGGGKEITFEVWARIERTPDPYNQLQNPYWAGIGIDYYDANGNKIANASNQLQAYPSATPGTFTRFSVTRVTPPNTAYAGVWAAKAGPYGELYLDDFCLTIAQDSQTVSFDSLSVKTVGDADFAPVASASSGLPITLSSSDTLVATITNGKIRIVGPGSSIITASQSGNNLYLAAASVQRTLTVLSGLKVLYMDGDTGKLTNNSARPYLKVVNESSVTVPYNELTIRYWFTAENYAGISHWIDYAQLGNNKVSMKYVELPNPRTSALGYIEYGFDPSAGGILPGSNSGQIKSRFANTDWQPLSEGNDYSYSNATTYTANPAITLYRNGKLWWGTEPGNIASDTTLKVYSENRNTSASSAIRAWLTIENTGNVPVDYRDLKIKYWFTADNAASLSYTIEYAKLGASNVSGVFGTDTGQYSDTYFESKIDSSVGKLYPLSSTGKIQYKIYRSDGSLFNETNDHSYMPAAPFAENSHIALYYKGVRIYGVEPLVSSSARITTKEASTGLQVTVLGNPTATEQADLRLSGLNGLPVRLQVVDTKGSVLLEKTVSAPLENTIQTVPLGKQAGIYLIRLGSGTQTTSVKVIKL